MIIGFNNVIGTTTLDFVIVHKLFLAIFARLKLYMNHDQISFPRKEVLLNRKLSLKSSCIWALVWPLKSLFHLQFECSHKMSEVWYNLLKLSMSSQGLQDFMLTRFESTKNMNNNEIVSKANPQLGVKLLCKSNWCRKTNLVFFFSKLKKWVLIHLVPIKIKITLTFQILARQK